MRRVRVASRVGRGAARPHPSESTAGPGFVRRNIVGQTAATVKPVWYRAWLPSSWRPYAPMPAAPARSPKPPPAPSADRPAEDVSANGRPGRELLPPGVAARSAKGAPASFTISDLAREFALTTRAIRFYEDEGLIAPERRGRARIYSERERVRIKLILRGKRLGLALSEIRELFDLYVTTRNEAPQLEKFLVMLADRRAMLMQQREDIDAVLAEIAVLERECRRRLKKHGPGVGAAGGPASRPG
jgi:DNA-binding transcriptional MerR regulator